MAKPVTNMIIEEDKSTSNRLVVWMPYHLVLAKETIEVIEGVVRVHHSMAEGNLGVWLNPCYDKGELMTEIKAALTDA